MKIRLNNIDYSYSMVSKLLTIHEKYKGSIILDETVPLLFGNLIISFDMTGIASTELQLKRYADDFKDEVVNSILLQQNEVNTITVKEQFFDSITIDGNFNPQKVSIYFIGRKLNKKEDMFKLVLNPVPTNVNYIPQQQIEIPKLDYIVTNQTRPFANTDNGNVLVVDALNNIQPHQLTLSENLRNDFNVSIATIVVSAVINVGDIQNYHAPNGLIIEPNKTATIGRDNTGRFLILT